MVAKKKKKMALQMKDLTAAINLLTKTFQRISSRGRKQLRNKPEICNNIRWYRKEFG